MTSAWHRRSFSVIRLYKTILKARGINHKKQQPPNQKPAPHRKKKRYEKFDAGQRVNYLQQGRETCIHTSSFISHDRMG